MEMSKGYHQLSVINTTMNELYIPLQGKHTTNSEEEPFDLAQKINEFFLFENANPNDPRVMLLMGDTGSGKSVFAQQVFQQLWKTRKENDPIPLWIPLPELLNPFDDAVEEILQKYKFSEAQIAGMKAKERFIFIVDGYDELHQFQNCYVTNKWEKWNAKVLTTCRSQAIYYQKDPDKYFMPFNGDKRLPMLLRRLYVAPFSKEQISAYVIKYQGLNPEHKFSEEDFTKVPGLIDLITTPFLLHLAVEALPDILAAQVDDEKMTQAKLYDIFIERWFTRQIVKLSVAGLLKDTEQTTKQQFWDYCKRLAQQMHAKELSVIPYQDQKIGGRLFGKQEQTNIWKPFFNENTEVLRSACPLKKMGEHYYGFIHASFVEYFATRAMYEELTRIMDMQAEFEEQPRYDQGLCRDDNSMKVQNDEAESQQKNNQIHGGIHQRVFAKERQGIQFLADRIEMNEGFKRKMRKLVEDSKRSKHYSTGAANAITALVRAGETFNGEDLRGIKIAGADISGGYFAGVDLSGSDMRKVGMARVYLGKGNLRGAHLAGVSFGEYPWIKQESFVWCMDYREDLKRVVTGCGRHVLIWDSVTGKCLHVLRGHEDEVMSVHFSGEGQRVVSGSRDHTARVWEVANGQAVVLQGHEGWVNSVQFSHDGHRVVSGSEDKTVRVWDLASRVAQILLKHEGEVKSIQFSRDSQWVVSGSKDHTVQVWEVASGKEKVRWEHKWVKSVQFSRDGQWVVSGGKDYTVRVWEVASGKVVLLRGHEGYVNSVQFSGDGQRVVSGSEDKTVRVWEVASGQAVVIRGHEDFVSSVQFSGDGQRVVSGSQDKTVRVWEVVSGAVQMLREHEREVSSVQFSGDGQRVVSGSWDKTVRVWDVASGQAVVLRGHYSWVSSVQFSVDGQRVVSGSEDNTVRVWEVASGQSVVLRGHLSHVNNVQFSGDGQRVVSSGDEPVRVWEVANGQAVLLRGHEGTVMSVHFSGDGRRVVSGSWDKTVRIWEVASGAALVLQGHEGGVTSVQFSRDSQRVVSGSWDKTVRVWDVASGHAVVLRGHEDGVTSVQFSGDGQRVLSKGDENTVRVWEVVSGASLVLRGHIGRVTHAQFSVDGQRVVSGGHDKTIRVWDVDQKRMIFCLALHSPVSAFSWHEDRGLLCVGFEDGIVQCWDVRGDHWQALRLNWTSSRPSPLLFLTGCDFRGAIGLSSLNERLLVQRGAIDNEQIDRSPMMGDQIEKIHQESEQQPEKPMVARSIKKLGGIFKKKEPTVAPSEKSASNKKKGFGKLSLFNRGSKAVEPKSRNKDEDRDDSSVKSLGRGNANE